jgi:hypothetical protein
MPMRKPSISRRVGAIAARRHQGRAIRQLQLHASLAPRRLGFDRVSSAGAVVEALPNSAIARNNLRRCPSDVTPIFSRS